MTALWWTVDFGLAALLIAWLIYIVFHCRHELTEWKSVPTGELWGREGCYCKKCGRYWER
jgi:hypothetical protein